MKNFIKILISIWNHPCNTSANERFKALSRMLRWQLATRILPEAYHALPYVNGSFLVARRGDVGVTGNWYNRLDEPMEMQFLLDYLKQDDLFVDIGANLGSYTILACSISGVRAIAYEPIPETAVKLRKNILANDFSHVAQTRMVGVSSRAGMLQFTSSEDSMNRVVEVSDLNLCPMVDVQVVTIDDELANLPLDQPVIMKIDVEGYENQVIDGAISVLSRPKTQVIIIETNGSGLRYGISDNIIYDKLVNLNFTPCVYDIKKRNLKVVNELNGKNGNTLFIKNIPEVNERLKNLKFVN